MKHKLLSLALSLAMVLSLLPAASLATEDKPERGVLTYTEYIKPQYDDAQSFSEGLAAVKQNGKWGYIDTDGKVVIPFQYDQAFAFNEGYAVVGTLSETEDMGESGYYDEELDEWVPDGSGEHDYLYYYDAGFVDKTGKYTPFMAGESLDWNGYYYTDSQEVYDSYTYIFHNGYVWLDMARESPGSLFDTTGREVCLTYRYTYSDSYGSHEGETETYPWNLPVNEGFVVVEEGYYDLARNTILELPEWTVNGHTLYSSNHASFNQGLAPVWEYNDEDDSYLLGFMNTSGQWAISPFPADRYWISSVNTSYRVFGETGLCMVSNPQQKYGAIDKTGRQVIPFRYDDLRVVYDGLIPFAENGKYGYLDAASLTPVIEAQYDNATGFNNGMAVVAKGGRAMVIDKSGKEIPGADKLDPDSYFRVDGEGNMTYYNPTEYVVIEENGKYGYGHVEYLPPLPEKDEMSDWAYTDVTAAIEADFIPVYLQNLYRNNITREEFCDTVVQAITAILDTDAETLVKERTGRELSDWKKEYPFRDTTNSSVIAAYALNIVAGRGEKAFDPYATIARQEAAAFLTRGAKVLGMDTTVTAGAGFSDGGQVDSWARDSVSFVSQIKVMSGTGDNMFTPQGTYSREQSFATVYRLYQAMLAQQQ